MQTPALYVAFGHWVALAVLAMLLVLAPLAFGGVLAWTWALVVVGLVLASGALVVGGWLAGLVERDRGPALPCLMIVLLVMACQQVPLPRSVMRGLAPHSEQIFSDALPPFAAGTLWLPLAHDRSGALEASLKGLSYALALLVARRVGRERAHVRWLLLLLVGVGCFQSFYGLVEQFAGEGRIFGWQKPATGERYRASGTFVNPNHFAGFLAMCASVGIAGLLLLRPLVHANQPGFQLDARQRLILALTSPNAPKLMLGVLAVLVIVAGIAGSASRGGLLAVGTGVGVCALFAWRSGRARVGVLLLAVIACATLWLATGSVARLATRLGNEQLLRDVTPGIRGRLTFAQHSLGMAADYPLTGVGVGSFEPAFLRYYKPPGVVVDHAHNDYVQLLAELGFLGWTALLVGLALLVRDVLRQSKLEESEDRRILAQVALAGVAPLVAHSLIDFNLRLPGTALWACVLLGLAWGVARPERTVTHPLPRNIFVRGMLGCALAAVGLSACWAAMGIARADWIAFPRVERALGDERASQVRLEDLERACTTWPWEAKHWAALAGLRYQLATEREIEQSEAAAERLSKALTDPAQRERVRLAVLTARLRNSQVMRGSQEQAAAEALKALQLAPGNKIYRDLWRSLRAN